jgi:competence protein ComEC
LRVRVGELELEVIGPVTRPEPVPDSPAENDSSLVVMVHAPGLRILLTGDLEPAGQAALLARGTDLRADVLKIPHHGSARQDPAFFAATGARVAIASAGRDNDYGHPAPRTVQLAQSLQMTVLRTDEQGSAAVTVRDGRVAAVTQR